MVTSLRALPPSFFSLFLWVLWLLWLEKSSCTPHFCVCDIFMQFISAWYILGFWVRSSRASPPKTPGSKGFVGYNRRMPWVSSTPPTPAAFCTNPLFFPNWKTCPVRAVGITWLWAWAGWYLERGHARAGCGSAGVQAVCLGDVSGLCNFARTLPCYTAALWLSENKWATYPTAKDRQWEVSVWYFHTQKSSPKLELQYKIPIQTSPAFCFHWLPSPACTHRVPSFPKENSIADKGHLSRQVITEQVSFCVCIWFLSQC